MGWTAIVNAFPIFSYGDGYIEERISSFPFDQEGMKRMWDWCECLSKNVMDFLRERGIGENDCSIICDLHMDSIWEKVDHTQCAYDHYCSLVAKYTS
jgi:hypothetical protein